MRTSIILTSLLATLALATPVDKRALTTKVEVYTVWTTVTRGAEPTGHNRSGGRHRHRSSSRLAEPSSAEPSAVSTSTEVVVSTSTPEPSPLSTEEAPIPAEPATTSLEETTSTTKTATTSVETPAATPDAAPAPVLAPTTPDSDEAVSEPAPVPSSPAPVVNVASSSYGQKILDQHNIHRANHTDTGPLSWSDELAATALKIANSCVYAHDTQTDKGSYSNGYGQNIGAGAPPEDVPAMITNGMYNDEAPAYEGLYGQDSPDMSNFEVWGHFSQIVWRNTEQVGCATVQCDSLQNAGGSIRPFFTVCNYAPPGNFGGQYTNVGTRLGKATVSI